MSGFLSKTVTQLSTWTGRKGDDDDLTSSFYIAVFQASLDYSKLGSREKFPLPNSS